MAARMCFPAAIAATAFLKESLIVLYIGRDTTIAF